MPRTPQQFEEIRNEKKRLIKDVALELFANQGYATTSISQIAQKANISKGLMYNYYESKENLLKSIVQSFMIEIADIMDPNHDDKIEDKEVIQFFDLIFDLLRLKRKQLKLFFQLSFQPEVMSLLNEINIFDKINEYTKMYAVYFSEKDTENAQYIAMNFANILKGFSMQYALSSDVFSEKELMQYKEYLKDIFVRHS